MAELHLNGLNLAAPADTQPRLSLVGSATPAILLGPGVSTTPDTRIYRSAAGALWIDTNGAAAQLGDVSILGGSSSGGADLRLFDKSGHSYPQVSIVTSGTALGSTAVEFGSGTAALDTVLYRSGAGALVLMAANLASTNPTLSLTPNAATSGSVVNLFNLTNLTYPSISLQTGTGALPNLQMGAGTAAADIYVRRSAAKTLTVDTDGAGGALTTVDFKTTNLYQNGAPFTLTQVQRASGAASDYLAEIKLTADTQYRLITGLDASSNPQILMGIGGTTAPDVRLYRTGAGVVQLDSNGAASQTQLGMVATSGHSNTLQMSVAGDTAARVVLEGDELAGMWLGFGPGNSAVDTRLYRNGYATLYLDDNASGSPVNFVMGPSDSGASSYLQIVVHRGTTQNATLLIAGGATATANESGLLISQSNSDTYHAVSLLSNTTNSVGTAGLLLGAGGSTAQDLRLYRGGAGYLYVDTNSAATTAGILLLSTSGQQALLSIMVSGDSINRSTLQGDATLTGLAFGPGSAAHDLFLRRSDAKTLIVDTDGAGGALTTVDFKTTNLYQNGSPITAVATQVQRASGAASDYLAEIKLTADTQYRLFAGLDASSNPQILLGAGGTTAPDIRLWRQSAGLAWFDSNGAAATTELAIIATAGHAAMIGVGVAGDTWDRVLLMANSTVTAGFGFGSGAATRDVLLYRSAAKTWEIDTDGALGALTLFDVRATSFTWNGLPVSRAVGQVVTINFVIDGGGSAITTGIKGDLVIDFACTIDSVTLLPDQSGSVVVDIWKQTYASFPPTVTQTITASAPPTITSATKSQDSTLTGWTTAISAGDVLRFNVNSASVVTRCTISLKVSRS